MSMKKTVAIAAAATALAAISVPAMAFENEFHGSYTFEGVFSNFQNGGAQNITPAGKAENQQMNNYFDQRARLQYIAKASDSLKLVTQFELDTRFGGITDGKYAGSSDAGTLDADGVSLETKHVYLQFECPLTGATVTTGVQPWTDSLKGVFAAAADVPAIVASKKFGTYGMTLGYARVSEAQQTGNPTGRIGDRAIDLFIFDNTMALSKDTKAGFAYYLRADYQTVNQPFTLHTFGLNGETKLGGLGLSGFAALQAGNQHQTGVGGTSKQFHGWAANAAAKMAAGPGTAKVAALFLSGNNSASASHYKGWVPLQGIPTAATGSTNAYNEGGMVIINRNLNDAPTSTDSRIRRTVSNLALLSAGYDANLTEKAFLNSNIGFAWTPASGETANSSDFMGTELNLEAGYKATANLTLSAKAAYMFLGGLYKNTASNGNDPENPYTMRLLAQFKF